MGDSFIQFIEYRIMNFTDFITKKVSLIEEVLNDQNMKHRSC